MLVEKRTRQGVEEGPRKELLLGLVIHTYHAANAIRVFSRATTVRLTSTLTAAKAQQH